MVVGEGDDENMDHVLFVLASLIRDSCCLQIVFGECRITMSEGGQLGQLFGPGFEARKKGRNLSPVRYVPIHFIFICS